MRKYEITYWAEFMDSPEYFEEFIQAYNIEEAIEKFKDKIRVYKRITQIKEL